MRLIRPKEFSTKILPVMLAIAWLIAPSPTLAQLPGIDRLNGEIDPESDSTNAPTVVDPSAIDKSPSTRLDNFTGLQVSRPINLSEYRLGPLDSIRIDIFNVPELSGEQTVTPNGDINISLLGPVRVAGLTLGETAALLEQELAPFLVRRIINVSLLAPRPLNIAVVGEVNRPGTVVMNYTGTGGTVSLASVTQALRRAGGTTQRADISNVQISRISTDGVRSVIDLDLLALVESGDISQDIILQDGDSIFVPRIADARLAQARQVRDASFASEQSIIQVVLTGEVNRTGPQTLSFTRGEGQEGNPFATVTRAIQQANGITELADIRNVEVRRINANGTQDVLVANLWSLIQDGDLDQDIQLVDGDSIHVPEVTDPVTAEYGQIAKATFSPDTITVRIIGEVNGPGSISLRPNAPFTEAIIAAGGITNDGDWRRVELYRISPSGKLTRRKLKADLDLAPNEDTNPGLRDRDFIVVRSSFGANILNTVTRTLSDIVTPITLLERLIDD